MRIFPRCLVASLALVFAGSLVPAQAQKAPILITADLTDAPRKLYHAEIDLPVTPGPVTLTTPQWIPGNHRPTGPASEITGVVFTANGQTLAWRRDDVNLYEFHLDYSRRRDQAARASGLHRHGARLAKAGSAGVGEAAALSGQHAGAGHSHPAFAEGSRGLGYRHRADAGQLRLLSRSGGRRDHAICC